MARQVVNDGDLGFDYRTKLNANFAELYTAVNSITEVNDLTQSVVWADVPAQHISQQAITQHQAALQISESQITDLQNYLTFETSHQDVLIDGDFPSQGLMTRGVSVGSYSITELSPNVGLGDSDAIVPTQRAVKEYINLLFGLTLGVIIVPSGDTASRPLIPQLGMIRYNSETDSFEGYTSSGWGGFGSGTATDAPPLGLANADGGTASSVFSGITYDGGTAFSNYIDSNTLDGGQASSSYSLTGVTLEGGSAETSLTGVIINAGNATSIPDGQTIDGGSANG